VNTKRILLVLLIAAFVASFVSTRVVNAEDEISDYDNVPSEQVVNDIDSVVNSSISEGEIKYDLNHTLYRVTVTPKNVIVGQEVMAIAETNNSFVTHVTFVWVKPFSEIEIETVQVYLEGGLKKADSTYTPQKIGLWWVFALFEKRPGSCMCGWLYAMRWTCFKVIGLEQQIPDYPVVGTAGAMATMFMGLCLFLNKKGKSPF